MKGLVLNHLDADDRLRVVRALEFTLDALPDLPRSCTGWGDRGRSFMEFRHPRATDPSNHEVHLTVDADQTMLRYRTMIDGKRVRTTIVEATDGIRRTRGETMEDAVHRVRGWLVEVEQASDSSQMEAYRSARQAAAAALLAAACRRNDGWSSASAEMGSLGSPPRVMLGYPDDRSLARYCGSGEPPCDGTLSRALGCALRSETAERHVVSARTVADPAPMFRFGPPPLIRIRSVDVSPVARLTAIAEAIEHGYELMSTETRLMDQDSGCS